MQDFLPLLLKILRSPWTYVYWAVYTAGTLAGHYNTAADGSPLLGAITILTLFCTTMVFYWHLRTLRSQESFRPKRSGTALFVGVWAFRLRLLLLIAPLFVIFYYWQGYEELFKTYLNFSMAPPEEKRTAFLSLLQESWFWFSLLPILWIFNCAGTSFVVAQGNSERAVAKTPFAILRQWKLILLFSLAGFILTFSLLGLEALGWGLETNSWNLLIVNILLGFLQYLVGLGGLVFIATRLWERSPELFSEDLVHSKH